MPGFSSFVRPAIPISLAVCVLVLWMVSSFALQRLVDHVRLDVSSAWTLTVRALAAERLSSTVTSSALVLDAVLDHAVADLVLWSRSRFVRSALSADRFPDSSVLASHLHPKLPIRTPFSEFALLSFDPARALSHQPVMSFSSLATATLLGGVPVFELVFDSGPSRALVVAVPVEVAAGRVVGVLYGVLSAEVLSGLLSRRLDRGLVPVASLRLVDRSGLILAASSGSESTGHLITDRYPGLGPVLSDPYLVPTSSDQAIFRLAGLRGSHGFDGAGASSPPWIVLGTLDLPIASPLPSELPFSDFGLAGLSSRLALVHHVAYAALVVLLTLGLGGLLALWALSLARCQILCEHALYESPDSVQEPHALAPRPVHVLWLTLSHIRNHVIILRRSRPIR